MFFGAPQKVITDEARIDEILSRGVEEIIPSKESLKALLLSGRRLRIKLGIDPTSPNIHAGRAVPLLKLKDFQDLGHTVVFIVGDFTAVIGDTSDKDAERPMLSDTEITNNMRTYRAQVGKVLDVSRAEFHHNSAWLGKLTYRDVGEHANIFSVADFISRDNIKRRLDAGKRVSLREVLYPLMQGYDSVAVRADVEIGGMDQRFNLLAGRPLQEKFGQAPQHCMLFSLMTDASGKKMSSSAGNTINITDAPGEMFGKTMKIPDDAIEQYFVAMTRVPLARVKELTRGHPRDAKLALAEEFVRLYHGDQAARKAREEFIRTFSQKDAPEDAPLCEIKNGDTLLDALVSCGAVSSKTDGRRLFEAGAVRVAGSDEKILDSSEVPESGTILRVGKHRFVKIQKSA